MPCYGMGLTQHPRGAATGYYPELNPLLPLDYHDRISGTAGKTPFA